MFKPRYRSLIPDSLLRLFKSSDDAKAKPEQTSSPRKPPATGRGGAEDQRTADAPLGRPREIITPEERARREMESAREYFKAAGTMEAFYDIYPSQVPPGHVSKAERAERDAQREAERAARYTRGRGSRGGQ